MQTVDITELELPVVKSAYKQVTGSVLKTKDEDEAREALESALEQKNMGLFFDEDGDLAIQPLKKAAKAKAKTPEPEEDEEEVEETPAPKSKAKAKAAPEPEEDDEEEIEEEPAPKPKAKAKAKAPEPEEDEVDEEPAPKTKAKKAKAADGEDAPKKERKSKKGVKPDFTPRLKKDAVLEIGDTSKAPRAESILGRAFAVIEDGMTYGDALEAIEKTFKGLDSKPTPGGVFANLLNRGAVKVAEAE